MRCRKCQRNATKEKKMKTADSTLHYVNGDTQERAEFARISVSMGHHCELYDDLSELAIHPPRHGIIIMNDDITLGGIALAMDRLEKLGIWLPVIAVGHSPSPHKIVDAIKVGALDYLNLPIEPGRLERSLSRTVNEAKRATEIRRRRIEAQELLNKLSERENQVLNFLTEGHSNKLIARALDISPRTVEIHRANMMAKLEAPHAASAVRIKLEAERPQIAA